VTIGSVTIDMPGTGTVMATASAYALLSGKTSIESQCYLELDGVQDSAGNLAELTTVEEYATVSVTASWPAAAGMHTASLECEAVGSGADVIIESPHLDVWTG
jgi:hypothetical protein